MDAPPPRHTHTHPYPRLFLALSCATTITNAAVGILGLTVLIKLFPGLWKMQPEIKTITKALTPVIYILLSKL